MQSQARVSLSKRTLFHRVIPIKQSERGIKVPARLPASLWETDSLAGGGFPFKGDKVCFESWTGFPKPCSLDAETSLSGQSDLLR